MSEHRIFIVRGSQPQAIGRELWRDGSRIRLWYHVGNWPFPKEATYDRSDLVYVTGPREPDDDPAPSAALPASTLAARPVEVEPAQVELL